MLLYQGVELVQDQKIQGLIADARKAVAPLAGGVLGTAGAVLAVDIQPEMLTLLRERANEANVKNVRIPVSSGVGTRLQLDPGGAALFADFRDDATLQTH